MKILLKNGKLYDGTGNVPFNGDLLIENDRIISIGRITKTELKNLDDIIDLKGLSVSSGFIDAHSHNDWFAIKKNTLKYFAPFIRQGITSFITGNCGFSAIGFSEKSPYIDKIGGGIFSFKGTTGQYESAKTFFAAIDNKCPCNIAILIGHNSVRTGICGLKNKPLTANQKKRIFATLEKNLQEGACGISLGLMSEPGLYANTKELCKVAELCEKYNKPLTVHPRAQSYVSKTYNGFFGRPHLLRALDDLVTVTKGKKIKLQCSQVIFAGRKSFKYKNTVARLLQKMRDNGVDAMFDIFCETQGVSQLSVMIPSWFLALSDKEKNKLLNIAKVKFQLAALKKFFGFDFSDIKIAYIGEEFERYEGKTIHEIAKKEGFSDIQTYLKLCECSNYTGRINIGPYSTSGIISELSKSDNCLYMTDAWVEEHGIQNPAIYDCFPKFLHFSLCGQGDSFAHSIRKMTGAVADRFNLKERGYLKKGYYADLTIFDEDDLRTGKPDRSWPFGIKYVYINGKKVFSKGILNLKTIESSGSAMRV